MAWGLGLLTGPVIVMPGVTSIAKFGSTPLTGAVTLSEGSNIILTQVGQNIEISGIAFALANGSGTTANGSAVDLGGTLTTNANINGDNTYSTIFSYQTGFRVGDNIYDSTANSTAGFIGFDPTSSIGWIGDYNTAHNGTAIIVDDLNKITKIRVNGPGGGQFMIQDSSLSGASNGYVWTLLDQSTGEGAWTVAPVLPGANISIFTNDAGYLTSVTNISGNAGTATTLQNTRTLWGQNFNGSANVIGSLTAVGDITGGASSMIITAGTGNSRTLILRSTTSGGIATAFLTGNADQTTTFGAGILGTGAWNITGGAGNMTILSGTGNSRTMILQTTTSGGVATTVLTLGANQSATFAGAIIGNTIQTASGALGITPAAGSNLNITLSTTGDFAVNTNQFYVDTSAARVGIGTTTPVNTLHVNGNTSINTTGADHVLNVGGEMRLYDNNGIYYVGASGNNTFKMGFLTSGFYGIGSSNDVSGLKFSSGDSYRPTIFNGEADGANVIGLTVQTTNTISTAGARLFRVLNNATQLLVLMANGNLGIGVTPTRILSLKAGESTALAQVGGVIFDHYTDVGNVGTGEDDLYSDTLAASILATNGDKIEAEYGGTFVSSATATREVKAYFGGTMIFDTGALTLSLSAAWTMFVTCIRVSSSVVRCMVSFTTEGAALAAYTSYTEVTGLTLTNTQVLKITGEAAGVGAATNDIIAKLGSISWFPAA